MPPGKITLNKLDVARHQLDTAIRMWFQEDDPVSVHTLIAAAHNVVHDVALTNKLEGTALFDENSLAEWGFDAKKYKHAIRKSENFFKHAKKDPHGVHEFSDEITGIMCVAAILCYKRLGGHLTVWMRFFNYWYSLFYAEELAEKHSDSFLDLARFVKTLPRIVFFAEFGKEFPVDG